MREICVNATVKTFITVLCAVGRIFSWLRDFKRLSFTVNVKRHIFEEKSSRMLLYFGKKFLYVDVMFCEIVKFVEYRLTSNPLLAFVKCNARSA